MANGQACVPLILLVLLTVTGSTNAGPCNASNWQSPIPIFENITIGEPIINWKTDEEVTKPGNFEWTRHDCQLASRLNVTTTGLVVKADFDLDSGEISSSSIRCYFKCKDKTMTVPPIPYEMKVFVKKINEHDPKFYNDEYHVTVPELSPIGYVVSNNIAWNVTDGDYGDKIRQYSFKSITDDAFYISDTSRGKIAVKKALDYETGPDNYTGILLAFDDDTKLERTGSATVYITVLDVDDQSPAFRSDHYSLQIPEKNSSWVNVPLWTSPKLQAFDQDLGVNCPVLYRLVPGPSEPPELHELYHKFTVDSENGSLTLTKLLDREQIRDAGINLPFSLYIEAYENSTAQRSNKTVVSVTVTDVDDNLPHFSQPLYTAEITEHPTSGSIVGFVTATDSDEGVNAYFTYKLLNGTKYFRIEGNQTGPGVIVVDNGRSLDRETNPTYWIKIGTDTDKYQNHTAILQITLQDVNDNTPAFRKKEYNFEVQNSTVPGGSFVAQVGDVLGTVSASDKDDGDNGRISYAFGSHGIDDYLSIDPTSGEITVSRTPLPLEGEIASMEFYVKAMDHGNPRLESVALVKVIQYSDSISYYLYPEVSATLLRRDRVPLQRNLSAILGVDVTIARVMPASKGGLDLSRSQVQLTAQHGNGTQLTRQELERLATHHEKEILALFEAYKQTTPAVERTEEGLGPAVIALIVIVCVVFITAIIVVLGYCHMARKMKKLARLDHHMTVRSTLYETQELKLDVQAETSDYDKSESLEDEDLADNVEDGISGPRWNPVYTGEDNVVNFSEVTELKQYCTYPQVRSSDHTESDASDTLKSPSDADTVVSPDKATDGSVTDEEDTEDVSSVPLYGATKDQASTLTESTTLPEPDKNSDGSRADSPVSETVSFEKEDDTERLDEVPPQTQLTPPGSPTLPTNEPSVPTTPTGSPAVPDGFIPVTPPIPVTNSEPQLPLKNTDFPEHYNPIEDYDMSTETGSVPDTDRGGPVIETGSEPDPDYENLVVPLPEPKPDYARVSFSDTTIAIDTDNKVEVIKQIHEEDESAKEEASTEPDDGDVTKDDIPPPEPDVSKKTPLISSNDEIVDDETPSTNDISDGKSDSKNSLLPSADTSEPPSKVTNFFFNPSFLQELREKAKKINSSNELSELSTRF